MLTERRRKILEFIQKYFNDHERYPTIREICNHFNLKSTNGVYEHLKALEREGYILIDRKKSRSMKVNFNNINLRKLPLLGIVPAGEPVYPLVEEGEYLDNVNDLIKGDFILKVKGDSMVNAGIYDGDLVSVDINREIKNNDIVVALIDGEVTLKRIKFDKDKIILQPENPDYKLIYVKNTNFKILGKAKMLIRKLE